MKALARLVVTSVILCSTAAWAQTPSLADVARKESERRKSVKAPAKVYTNSDLPKPATTTVTEVKEDGTKVTAATSGDKSEVPAEAVEGVEKATAELGQWAAKLADARERLEAAKKNASELQTRVNELAIAHINEPSYEKKGPLLAQRDRVAAELAEANAKLAVEMKAYMEAELEAREMVAKKAGGQ